MVVAEEIVVSLLLLVLVLSIVRVIFQEFCLAHPVVRPSRVNPLSFVCANIHTRTRTILEKERERGPFRMHAPSAAHDGKSNDDRVLRTAKNVV